MNSLPLPQRQFPCPSPLSAPCARWLTGAAAAVSVALSSASAEAQLYVDVFDRETLGPDWAQFIEVTPTPDIFYPYNRYLVNTPTPGRSLVGYTGVELPEEFGVSLTAQIHISLAGMAFNIQDADNFYAVRAWIDVTNDRTLVQLLKTVDGVDNGLASFYTEMISTDLLYEFSVSSTGNGAFEYSLSDLDGNLLGASSFVDSINPFTGGYGGILVDGQFLVATKFVVVPEPSSVVLLTAAGGLAAFSLRRSRKVVA